MWLRLPAWIALQLNEVTGKVGFMARSCCNATEAYKPGCGVGTWVHDNEIWHNSTAKGYEGWTWKGDTSSDESTGHMFAFAVRPTRCDPPFLTTFPRNTPAVHILGGSPPRASVETPSQPPQPPRPPYACGRSASCPCG